LIEPIKWAGSTLPANHHIHFEFLCVHHASITSRGASFWRDERLTRVLCDF
jgi:hypothetical protein